MAATDCDAHAGTEHADYPHPPGQHYGCYACERYHHPSAEQACVCDDCVGFIPFDMADSDDFA